MNESISPVDIFMVIIYCSNLGTSLWALAMSLPCAMSFVWFSIHGKRKPLAFAAPFKGEGGGDVRGIGGGEKTVACSLPLVPFVYMPS